MRWIEKWFHELSAAELYELLALRQRVFVVEQACAYLDADGHDATALHLWGVADGAVRAYLRILPPGDKYVEPSIGRVITAPAARGSGLGRALMERGIARLAVHFGPLPIRIGAQARLERFYASLGFVRASADYDEDGIPHLEMVRAGSGAGTGRDAISQPAR